MTERGKAMKSIRKVEGNLRLWIGPIALDGINRFSHYRMWGDNNIVATIDWQKPSGSLAIAECSEGKYSLKRAGFLKPFATIRKMGLDNEVGRIEIGLRKATIISELGQKMVFQKLKNKKFQKGLRDDRDNSLCIFDLEVCRASDRGVSWAFDLGGISRASDTVDVDITNLGKRRQDLSLAIILIWYYLILNRRKENNVIRSTGTS
jgi:hypothetical protein